MLAKKLSQPEVYNFAWQIYSSGLIFSLFNSYHKIYKLLNQFTSFVFSQVDKMYDISTSKYKQLEKIRNVSSENIDATENENKMQEDKFQAWEPKSKRMLQFFLTDGVQDILAIEFKTIRFLKVNDIRLFITSRNHLYLSNYCFRTCCQVIN